MFAEIVIEGLSRLDDVICAVMLSALMTIVEVGVNFIPGGGAVSRATRAVVEGAKTFEENVLDGESLFTGWIGPACGIPEFEFNLMDTFEDLITAPDSMGESIGCMRRNKKNCKDRDDRPDSTSTRHEEETASATKTTDTATTEPTTTETGSPDEEDTADSIADVVDGLTGLPGTIQDIIDMIQDGEAENDGSDPGDDAPEVEDEPEGGIDYWKCKLW